MDDREALECMKKLLEFCRHQRICRECKLKRLDLFDMQEIKANLYAKCELNANAR